MHRWISMDHTLRPPKVHRVPRLAVRILAVVLLAVSTRDVAAADRVVADLCAEFAKARIPSGDKSEVGLASIGHAQGTALLQSPVAKGANTVTYSIDLPTVGENEKLGLVFAYGISSEKDDAAAKRLKTGVWFSVAIDDSQVFHMNVSKVAWTNRCLNLTPYAGRSIAIGFGSDSTDLLAPARACWVSPQIIRYTDPDGAKTIPHENVLINDSAEIVFGPKDETRGIKRADNVDEGRSSFEVIDGLNFGTPGKASPSAVRMFYFDIDDRFTRAGDWANFAMVVDYLDYGRGIIDLEYDSFDTSLERAPGVPGAFKTADSFIRMGDSGNVKTHTFRLRDAWFANACNNADFRLRSTANFYIHRIRLLKLYPRMQPHKSLRGVGRFRSTRIVPPEKDPASNTRSGLDDVSRESNEIRFTDVDKDGDPDILERCWNNRRVRWFDENDTMTDTDRRGDIVEDFLQVDYDDDAYYDGAADVSIDWLDDDADGDADAQIVSINPDAGAPNPWGGVAHYMYFLDADDDQVLGYMDWSEWKPFTGQCWRTTRGPNFSPDYNGDGDFLKAHLPPFAIEDPRYNWENPFSFYDKDGDGCTEMAIRVCDAPQPAAGDDSPLRAIDGKAEEAFFTFDLDNDSRRTNEMDYDMTIKMFGGELMDYSKFVNPHPTLKAPDWVVERMRFPNWRQIDSVIHLPHDKAFQEIVKPKWGAAYFVFDEDDDDHRWERVELYLPGDPYAPRSPNHPGAKGISWHPQSDSLGDRGEFDEDYSGNAKLYVGAWDRKIHLVGAEWGAWTVDYGAKYWGSWPVVGDSSTQCADAAEEVVQYRDTNDNGFFDEIAFDYDGDKTIDFTANLLALAPAGQDDRDVREIVDPAQENWEGMHALFTRIADEAWAEAHALYRAAWKKGFSTPELDDPAIAASTHEKHEHAYWLKEKIRRDLMRRADPETAGKITTLYFTGDLRGLARLVEERTWE